MTLYLIPGLGADYRVFQYLSLNHPSVCIKWIDVQKGESIQEYCKRLSAQIDDSQSFALIGVSFGGIIAVELNKILKPELSIIISSVIHSNQLPQKLIKLGKTGILKLVPDGLMKPPAMLLAYLFGTKKQELLSEILQDADIHFIRWALTAIIRWENNFTPGNCVRIHGTRDKLIPLIGSAITVNGGQHFMIVDKAEEVSAIINKIIDGHK